MTNEEREKNIREAPQRISYSVEEVLEWMNRPAFMGLNSDGTREWFTKEQISPAVERAQMYLEKYGVDLLGIDMLFYHKASVYYQWKDDGALYKRALQLDEGVVPTRGYCGLNWCIQEGHIH